MKRLLLTAAVVMIPALSQAQTSQDIIADTVTAHILPRFDALAAQTAQFAATAQNDCDPTSAVLRASYGSAFDAWLSVSHLRFGPTEVGDRAFALAFWPDSRGATPRALATLIADQDPVALDAASYAQVSIAARGFYAMEFLLFDAALNTNPQYLCTLVQTVATDIATTSAAIARDWIASYARLMRTPAPTTPYRSEEEVLQELFKALTTGLQFTSETRLGRPLARSNARAPPEPRYGARTALHAMLR